MILVQIFLWFCEIFISIVLIMYGGIANNPDFAPPDAHRPFYVVFGIIGLIVGIVIAKRFFDSAQKEWDERIEQRRQLKQELDQYASISSWSEPGKIGVYETLFLKKRTPQFSKAFSIVDDTITPMSYNPAKYIYTSATVGGITTGGIDKVGGNYVKGKKVNSGKCELHYFGKKVQRIQLSGELFKMAQKSAIKKYLNDEGQIVVEEKVRGGAVVAAQMFGALSADGQILLHDGYPTLEKCQEIIDWICKDN